jgi:hypothetical protein
MTGLKHIELRQRVIFYGTSKNLSHVYAREIGQLKPMLQAKKPGMEWPGL